MTEPLTLALISDIHHGEDDGTKAGGRALEFVRDFVDAVNGMAVDLVVELGDPNPLPSRWNRDAFSLGVRWIIGNNGQGL